MKYHPADDRDPFFRSLWTHEDWMRKKFREDVSDVMWFGAAVRNHERVNTSRGILEQLKQVE